MLHEVWQKRPRYVKTYVHFCLRLGRNSLNIYWKPAVLLRCCCRTDITSGHARQNSTCLSGRRNFKWHANIHALLILLRKEDIANVRHEIDIPQFRRFLLHDKLVVKYYDELCRHDTKNKFNHTCNYSLLAVVIEIREKSELYAQWIHNHYQGLSLHCYYKHQEKICRGLTCLILIYASNLDCNRAVTHVEGRNLVSSLIAIFRRNAQLIHFHLLWSIKSSTMVDYTEIEWYNIFIHRVLTLYNLT
jgi:hypothetical protein